MKKKTIHMNKRTIRRIRRALTRLQSERSDDRLTQLFCQDKAAVIPERSPSEDEGELFRPRLHFIPEE